MPLSVIRVPKMADTLSDSVSAGSREFLSEEDFTRMIAIERKRTERSKEPFLLMLLEAADRQASNNSGGTLDKVVTALLPTTRETDVVGWYKDRTAVGVMFTGLNVNVEDKNLILDAIGNRLSAKLRETLAFESFEQITMSFHFFPDDWNHDKPGRPTNLTLYPDLVNRDTSRRFPLILKRTIDVVGSAGMLILFSPILLMIALLIKASSKGPVLFRQRRIGQHGRQFTFLKFRSMRVDNDNSVHREYVTKLIANEAGRQQSGGPGDGIFKLTNDKRVTPVGKLLRRTSFDELPQFLNVLKGEMSLVGPRPPLPYELAVYQTWHRRRVLEAKPGITGLWQVTGRSRVKFDEMVRLDLYYARSWSPWLDLKILMKTPLAVIKGAGAC
jgi:lipopolysaccharide/colanic/teichoic acid biosynthesis glycosyltransferase